MNLVGRTEEWLFGARRASYAVAVIRILFGLGMLAFLFTNLADRHYLWGDAARWQTPIADNGGFGFPFTLFDAGRSPGTLTLLYLALLGLVVIFTLGWQTRFVTPLVLIAWTSLIESNVVYGDQSDNIVRILLLYLCFADLSGRWSLDERRRRRRSRAPTLMGTLLHNLAVVAVGAQLCLVYVASAMYKIQGDAWQEGTAIYYPLQIDVYRPWPALADLLTANSLVLLAATYFTVFIQLFFPFLLLRRSTRIFALVGVTAMHLGIAVVMGMPFFSLFVLAADAVFIRDTTFEEVAGRARRRLVATHR